MTDVVVRESVSRLLQHLIKVRTLLGVKITAFKQRGGDTNHMEQMYRKVNETHLELSNMLNGAPLNLEEPVSLSSLEKKE